MKTDDLINAIAEDAAARLPSLGARMAVALAVGGAASVALFAYRLGVRPDIASAMLPWRFDAKLATTLLCFVTAPWATVRLAQPDAVQRHALATLLLPLLGLALAIGWELVASPAGTWYARAEAYRALGA